MVRMSPKAPPDQLPPWMIEKIKQEEEEKRRREEEERRIRLPAPEPPMGEPPEPRRDDEPREQRGVVVIQL